MVGYAVLLVSFPLTMSRWPLPWADESGWSRADHSRTYSSRATHRRTGPGMHRPVRPRSMRCARAATAVHVAGDPGGTDCGAGRCDRVRVDQSRCACWADSSCSLAGSSAGRSRWPCCGACRCPRRSPMRSIRARIPAPCSTLVSGATMLGAFFIATDPVSAATSDRGRLWYGAGIGVSTWIIRRWGGYPDGVRLRRAALEPRRATHRPLHGAKHLWPPP